MTKKEIVEIHLAQIDPEISSFEDMINEAKIAVWVVSNPLSSYEDYKGMCLHFNTMCVAREDWPICKPINGIFA